MRIPWTITFRSPQRTALCRLLLLPITFAAVPYAAGEPRPLVLTGAKVLDPADGVIREGLQVVIADQRIVETQVDAEPVPGGSISVHSDGFKIDILATIVDR